MNRRKFILLWHVNPIDFNTEPSKIDQDIETLLEGLRSSLGEFDIESYYNYQLKSYYRTLLCLTFSDSVEPCVYFVNDAYNTVLTELTEDFLTHLNCDGQDIINVGSNNIAQSPCSPETFYKPFVQFNREKFRLVN